MLINVMALGIDLLTTSTGVSITRLRFSSSTLTKRFSASWCSSLTGSSSGPCSSITMFCAGFPGTPCRPFSNDWEVMWIWLMNYWQKLWSSLLFFKIKDSFSSFKVQRYDPIISMLEHAVWSILPTVCRSSVIHHFSNLAGLMRIVIWWSFNWCDQ